MLTSVLNLNKKTKNIFIIITFYIKRYGYGSEEYHDMKKNNIISQGSWSYI